MLFFIDKNVNGDEIQKAIGISQMNKVNSKSELLKPGKKTIDSIPSGHTDILEMLRRPNLFFMHL